MDKKSLERLSKRELIRRLLSAIEDQRKLEQRVDELERYLRAFDNPHTPPSKQRKKNSGKNGGKKPRFPGKPKGGKGGGIKMPPPDKVVEHPLDACSKCNGIHLKDVGFFKHTIIDLPEKPIQVFEHRIIKYHCGDCNTVVWKDVALPRGIYGPRLQSLAAMLKNLTNSHVKIADLFRELGAPSFSNTTVQRIAGRFAQRLKGLRKILLNQLRKAPYVHLDETGFRRDGQNGYIWGAFTDKIAILKAEISRARIHITTLMEGFKGVVVTDGYNAYDEFPLRQRCWSHLMRDFKDCAEDNPEIEVQYQRIKKLYERLKEMNTGPPDADAIAKAKWELQDIVTCLKTVKGGKKLATLIENGGDDWFTALYYDGVPLDNNHAERELRPIVLLRKSIGCYRNDKGKDWIDIVVSVIHTWKLRGENVFQQLTAIASTA